MKNPKEITFRYLASCFTGIIQYIGLHTKDSTLWTTDTLLWRWGGKCFFFSTKLTYEFLSIRGVKQEHALIWWEQKLPMKINFLMWLLKKNRILIRASYKKNGWQGDPYCHLKKYWKCRPLDCFMSPCQRSVVLDRRTSNTHGVMFKMSCNMPWASPWHNSMLFFVVFNA